MTRVSALHPRLAGKGGSSSITTVAASHVPHRTGGWRDKLKDLAKEKAQALGDKAREKARELAEKHLPPTALEGLRPGAEEAGADPGSASLPMPTPDWAMNRPREAVKWELNAPAYISSERLELNNGAPVTLDAKGKPLRDPATGQPRATPLVLPMGTDGHVRAVGADFVVFEPATPVEPYDPDSGRPPPRYRVHKDDLMPTRPEIERKWSRLSLRGRVSSATRVSARTLVGETRVTTAALLVDAQLPNTTGWSNAGTDGRRTTAAFPGSGGADVGSLDGRVLVAGTGGRLRQRDDRRTSAGELALRHRALAGRTDGNNRSAAGDEDLASISCADMQTALTTNGFEWKRNNGDHRLYKHADGRLAQIDWGVDPIPPDNIRKHILKQTRWTRAQLLEALGRGGPRSKAVRPEPTAVVNLTGEEFIVAPPKGFLSGRLPAGQHARTEADGSITLADSFFDLEPAARLQLLEGLERMATTRTAERMLLWHGTAGANLRGILVNGLQPGHPAQYDDSQRGDTSVSIKTMGGVYFTANWMTAYSHAGNADRQSGRRGGENGTRVILGVTLETRSPGVLADEDSLNGSISSAFQATSARDIAYRSVLAPVLRALKGYDQTIRLGKWPEAVAAVSVMDLTKAGEALVANMLSRSKSPRAQRAYAEQKDEVDPLATEVIRSFGLHLLDKAFDDDRYHAQYRRENIDRNDAGSIQQIEQQIAELQAQPKPPELQNSFARYRDAVTAFSHKTRWMTDPREDDLFSFTLRSLNPIGFRGKNRIVIVGSVYNQQAQRSSDDREYPPSYATIQFSVGAENRAPWLEGYRQHIGGAWRVLDGSGALLEYNLGRDAPWPKDFWGPAPADPATRVALTTVVAAMGALSWSRSGYQRYRSSFTDEDGTNHKLWIGAEQAVEHGSYGGGSRQRRKTTWRLRIDGEDIGEAGTFREARELAEHHFGLEAPEAPDEPMVADTPALPMPAARTPVPAIPARPRVPALPPQQQYHPASAPAATVVSARRVLALDENAQAEVTWAGLRVAIEHVGGSRRYEGTTREVEIPGDWVGYGFLRGITGADGDSLDIVLGPGGMGDDGEDDGEVYVAAQRKPEGHNGGPGGGFLQWKVMAQFPDEQAARMAFAHLWPPEMFGAMRAFPQDQFLTDVLPALAQEDVNEPRRSHVAQAEESKPLAREAKGLSWRGHRIVLEAEGGERRPTGDEQYLPADAFQGLGYFADRIDRMAKDPLDVVIGPDGLDDDADVYLVAQLDEDKHPRQWKVYLGYPDAAAVEAAFAMVWLPETFGGAHRVPAKKFEKYVLARISKKAMQKVAIEQFFHGTTKERAALILQQGFSFELAGERQRGFHGPDAPDPRAIFLTADERRAEWYAGPAGVVLTVAVSGQILSEDAWREYLDAARADLNIQPFDGRLQEAYDQATQSVLADGAVGAYEFQRASEVMIFDPAALQVVGSSVEGSRSAAVALPPRKPAQFVTVTLGGVLQRFAAATTALSAGIASLSEDARYDSGLSSWRVGKGLEHLESIVQTVGQFPKEGWAYKHLPEALERALEGDYSSLKAIERVAQELDLEQVARGITEFNEYAVKYQEPQADPRVIQLARGWVEAVAALRPTLTDALAKVREMMRGGRGDEAPAHEAVETLYHATMNLRELASAGFQAEVPEKGGLGGSQSTKGGEKGVSFTADLYVAKEIVRCFKEAAGIANGEYGWQDVLTWAAQDGADSAEVEDLAKTTSRAPTRPIPQEHRQDPANWRGEGRPHKTDPEHVFGLYQAYLAVSKRYNPLFFGVSAKTFRGKDPADIGILKAKIDMTNPDILWAAAMAEFRVPVSAILSIEGVVSDRPGATRVSAAEVVARSAAGLIDLKGLDDVIAKPLSDAVWEVVRESPAPKSLDDLNQMALRVIKVFGQKAGAFGTFQSGAPLNRWSEASDLLSNTKAQTWFGLTRLQLDPSRLTFMRPGRMHQDPAEVHIGIIALIQDRLKGGDTFAEAKKLLSHEIRHAADWTYQAVAGGKLFTRTNPKVDPESDKPGYYNQPTEMYSYAGNAAESIWRQVKDGWRELSGQELVGYIELLNPKVMKHLTPGNRAPFLQRVMKGLEQLEAQHARVSGGTGGPGYEPTATIVGGLLRVTAAEVLAAWEVIAGRLEEVKKRYRDRAPQSESIIDQLAAGDPSGSQKYLAWMAQQVVDAGEPAAEVIDLAARFHKQQGRLPKDQRDLSRMTLEQAEWLVGHVEMQQTHGQQKEEVGKGSKVLAKTPEYTVTEILSKAASCALGRGTKWCITEQDASHFEDYVERGIRFFFVVEPGEVKHAVAVGTGGNLEVYDAEDHTVSPTVLPEGVLGVVYQALGYTQENAPQATEQSRARGLRLNTLLNHPYTSDALIDAELKPLLAMSGNTPWFEPEQVNKLLLRPRLTATMKAAVLHGLRNSTGGEFGDPTYQALAANGNFALDEILAILPSKPELGAYLLQNPNIDPAALLDATYWNSLPVVTSELLMAARYVPEVLWSRLLEELPTFLEEDQSTVNKLLRRRDVPPAVRNTLLHWMADHGFALADTGNGVSADVAERYFTEGRSLSPALAQSPHVPFDKILAVMKDSVQNPKSPYHDSADWLHLYKGLLLRPDLTAEQLTQADVVANSSELSSHVRALRLDAYRRSTNPVVIVQAIASDDSTSEIHVATNPNLTPEQLSTLVQYSKSEKGYHLQAAVLLAERLLEHHAKDFSAKDIQTLFTSWPRAVLRKAPQIVPTAILQKQLQTSEDPGVQREIGYELRRREVLDFLVAGASAQGPQDLQFWRNRNNPARIEVSGTIWVEVRMTRGESAKLPVYIHREADELGNPYDANAPLVFTPTPFGAWSAAPRGMTHDDEEALEAVHSAAEQAAQSQLPAIERAMDDWVEDSKPRAPGTGGQPADLFNLLQQLPAREGARAATRVSAEAVLAGFDVVAGRLQDVQRRYQDRGPQAAELGEFDLTEQDNAPDWLTTEANPYLYDKTVQAVFKASEPLIPELQEQYDDWRKEQDAEEAEEEERRRLDWEADQEDNFEVDGAAPNAVTRVTAGPRQPPSRAEQLAKQYPQIAQGIREVAAADPSGSQKFLDWAVKQLLAGEQATAINQGLYEFWRNLPALKGKDREIETYAHPIELLEIGRAARPGTEKAPVVLLNKDGWRATECFNQQSIARLLGCTETEWCVTWPEAHYWTEYTHKPGWRLLVIQGPGDNYLLYVRGNRAVELADSENVAVGPRDSVWNVVTALGFTSEAADSASWTAASREIDRLVVATGLYWLALEVEGKIHAIALDERWNGEQLIAHAVSSMRTQNVGRNMGVEDMAALVLDKLLENEFEPVSQVVQQWSCSPSVKGRFLAQLVPSYNEQAMHCAEILGQLSAEKWGGLARLNKYPLPEPVRLLSIGLRDNDRAAWAKLSEYAKNADTDILQTLNRKKPRKPKATRVSAAQLTAQAAQPSPQLLARYRQLYAAAQAAGAPAGLEGLMLTWAHTKSTAYLPDPDGGDFLPTWEEMGGDAWLEPWLEELQGNLTRGVLPARGRGAAARPRFKPSAISSFLYETF